MRKGSNPGGEVLYGIRLLPLVKIQPTTSAMASRWYNSELQNFSISGGTTGEAILVTALLVCESRRPRTSGWCYAISETTGARVAQAYDVDATIIGNGDNSLFGVGKTKNDFFLCGTQVTKPPGTGGWCQCERAADQCL